jgi:hypothetical protein
VATVRDRPLMLHCVTMTTAAAPAPPIRPCPRCLAEPPGRILVLPARGWHHVCDLDVWRAAGMGGASRATVQVAGVGHRCPICHGRGHGGTAPSSGPLSCPGAERMLPDIQLPRLCRCASCAARMTARERTARAAAEAAAEAARAWDRRVLAVRAVLGVAWLLALLALLVWLAMRLPA